MNTVISRSLAVSAALWLGHAAVAQGDIPADKDQVTTESGLQYSVLTPGEPGEKPMMGDEVTVHYTGWLTDGTQFDSSRKRGSPSTFRLGQVIQGWNEGLQLMTPGARYKFTIPYDLAYGERGRQPTIPAKATLIFDVELLSFRSAPRFTKPDPEAQTQHESGFKYQVLEEGTGETPTQNERIEFDYSYWNTDGVLINTSAFSPRRPQGIPAQFRLDVLKLAPTVMKEGGRYLLEVPAELAHGGDDGGPTLPPNSTTVWEIKLHKVHKPLKVPDFVMPKGEDLIKTDSGLKYQVVKQGEGVPPRMGQMVSVHYAGWLTDGTPFDNSYERGSPSDFRLGQVIQGWNEGLQLMKPGAVFRLVIPADLGYGKRGSPPTIPGGATLVFHVELLEVK